MFLNNKICLPILKEWNKNRIKHKFVSSALLVNFTEISVVRRTEISVVHFITEISVKLTSKADETNFKPKFEINSFLVIGFLGDNYWAVGYTGYQSIQNYLQWCALACKNGYKWLTFKTGIMRICCIEIRNL